MWKLLSALSATAFLGCLSQAQGPQITAVTFAAEPNEVYLPLRETAAILNWPVGWDDAASKVLLRDKPLSAESIRRLPSHRAFIRLSSLVALGAEAASTDGGQTLEVRDGEAKAEIVIPEQRVEICLDRQMLVAYQGDNIVLETKISSGRRGFGTPAGKYKARTKERHRVSRKYDNAPMPYAVNLVGGYFIHGSPSVPRLPASHGCIRVPLTGDNPASRFFQWIELGTPIAIARGWSPGVQALLSPKQPSSEDGAAREPGAR